MSTVQKVNFEPVSNVMHIQTRDFPLVDPTIANPYDADALVDGEWMAVTSAYKMERAADVASAGNVATAHSYPYWMEKGRYDVQAQAERKGAILWLGAWEFDSRIYLETGMTFGGLVSVTSIQPVASGKIYSGLVNNGTIATPLTGITVGYITRLPSTNGGKLRIRGGTLY
jgi:hypothetical protein